MQREKSAIARETRTRTEHGAAFSDRRVDDFRDAFRTREIVICAEHSSCMWALDRYAADRPSGCCPRRGGSCFMSPAFGDASCSEVGRWLGLADYGFGSATAGPAARVGAVFIGVAQVAFEFAPEAGLLGDQVAGEGLLPACSDDRALDALDAPVGLRSAGVDEALASAEFRDGPAERAGAELGAVVGNHALQPPTAGGQILGDAASQLPGPTGQRVAWRRVRLGPGVGRGDPSSSAGHIDRGVLPDRARSSRAAANVEAFELHQLNWSGGIEVAFRLRDVGRRFGHDRVASDQA